MTNQSRVLLLRALPTALLGVLLLGCGPHRIEDAYSPRGEREALLTSMETLDIGSTEYGRQWTTAFDEAWEFPEIVRLPYTETFILDPLVPAARVVEVSITEPGKYRFAAEAGSDTYLFMELYRLRREEFRLEASRATDAAEIVVDVRRSGDYRLVLHPEPLRGGRIQLRIEAIEEG